jgi:DNA-damage-inducible protein D
MSNVKLFESKHIRSVWNETEQKWYFSVQDVMEILTDSSDIKQYIKRMLSRDEMLKTNWGTICPLVEMEAADGKKRKVQAADTKGILRIIQSIPSPKAEPFKLWLAQVGSDRLDEIENPELATQRTRELYKQKGYSEDWIEKRMRSIAIREENWKESSIEKKLPTAA